MYERKTYNEKDVLYASDMNRIEEMLSQFYKPNLLINSDFRNPVNQRSLSLYEGGTDKVYTIDRWCMGNQDYSRKVEIVNGGVKVTNPNTEYAGTFQQILEHALPKGTYTVTVSVKAISGSAIVSVGGVAKSLKAGINELTVSNVQIDLILISVGANSNITLEYIKLEAGNIATQFIPRAYGEELALCKRYYQLISPYKIGMYADTKTMVIPIPDLGMRVTPDVEITQSDLENVASVSYWANFRMLQIFLTASSVGRVQCSLAIELDAEIR